MNKRALLEGIGAIGIMSIAGCSGNSSDDSGATSSDQSTTEIPPATGSWQTYQSNNSNTGRIIGASLPIDPETEWEYETDADRFSSPVVADSTLYVCDSSGSVFSLAATTGEENWTFDYTGQRFGPDSLLLDDSTLYVSGDNGVVAINVEDGTETWETDISAGPLKKMGDTVYIAGSDVVAMNTGDGSVAWKNEEIFSDTPPAVTEEYVFVSSSETLYALDAGSGAIEWEYDGGFGDEMSDLTAPSIHGSTVYFAAQVGIPEKIYTVDAQSGQEQFSDLVGDRRSVPVGSISFSGDSMVAIEEHGTVFSRPVEGGYSDWTIDIGVGADSAGPPIVVENDVVVTTSKGTYAFDSEGETKWSHDAGNYSGPPPIAVDEWVFVCDGEGTLHALH